MRYPTVCVLAVACLAGCATPAQRGPDEVLAPVSAGDGLVWVAKQMDGQPAALWGPRDSEAIFAITCDQPSGMVGFHHYAVSEGARPESLQMDAGDAKADYPAELEEGPMGTTLLATTTGDDPFLDALLRQPQVQVVAGGEPLLINLSASTFAPVIQACRA